MNKLIVFLVIVALFMSSPPTNLRAENDSFTIVVLPDTQYYSTWHPEVFESQTQWIADNRERENIRAVAHVGDVINNPPQAYQWETASAAMDLISEIPTVVTPGNHDVLPDPNGTLFRQHFGPPNNFQIIEEDYLLISIAGFGNDMQETFEWANSTLSTYSNLKAIIVTHSYIDDDGAKTLEGQLLWDNIIRGHSNVVMVLCGHRYEEKYIVEYGDNGNKINVLLANYQQRLGELQAFTGGQGWLRLLQFQGSTVSVKTYTPTYNKWESDSDSEFVFDLYTGEIPDIDYGEQAVDNTDEDRFRAYLLENTIIDISSLEVKFGGERYDSNMHSPGSKKFYIRKSGVYLIGASASFSAYPEGLRSMAIFYYSPGCTIITHVASKKVHNNGDATSVSMLLNAQFYLKEGHYLTLSISHNAGVPLLLLGKGYTEFWAYRLGD